MKSLLICAFVLYAVSVIAERCHHGDDCVVTVCSGNSSHIACHNDRCTCDAVIACTDITDCMTVGRCHDRDRHYHCLDRMCVCLKDEDIP
ncbi:serine protease inhibitor Cvsi-1-like [Crassostrea angulata]|uniref:serine protease inhibitor Cvsi-1-like n=1 Tax=Magallana angulata TaxID=2784310 RepID=UPI0022B19B9D|nr:serine protease inhibitor Cvsi-1-like [Crassostrea angulata]